MFDESPLHPHRAMSSARVQAGLGAIPRISGDGQSIYRRKLAWADGQHRIAAVHRPYHTILQNLGERNQGVIRLFGC